MAAGHCQLQQLGTLPVDMHGLRPIVSAKINGVAARFVLDSGSFYTTISRDAAAQYRLPIDPRSGFLVTGVGGSERAQIATAESFDFLGVPLSNIRFAVVDQDLGELAGLLGQNLLHVSDVEYDLANGVVRFIRPVGCADQPLAYWAVSTPYSAVDLHYIDAGQSHLLATAMINGQRITVMFDTGASRSLLSLQAAERAGITTSSAGVTSMGAVAGIGPGTVRVWIAPVASFQVGGEKVEHAHLLIGNLGPTIPLGYVGDRPPDMLLGEDFFLAHRILVSYSQRKLYFTYNGGPLFNLNLPEVVSGKASLPATSSGSQTTATGGQASSNTPADADELRRQGMAYASMNEFDRALSDLTRACELAPRDAENHYDRGVIYSQEKQYKSALADFDSAIALQPDDMDAHLARAKLLRSQPGADAAASGAETKADLDAVSHLAAPAASVRLTLADLYDELGDYPDAIGQVDDWLNGHTLVDEQAFGWNDRCRLRAAANRDLLGALADCNRVLDLDLRESAAYTYIHASGALETRRHLEALDNRGLVYLRLGNLKDAVRDYDAALQVNPNIPSAVFGRGLAELRLGEKAQGQSDLAAAAKLDSGTAKRFADMGLVP